MSRSKSAAALGIAIAGLAACGAPTTHERTSALTTTTTFMHAGFEAGPTLFTDAAGHVLEERRYEPFGASLDAADLAARDLDALNKRRDPGTGWSDHGARWMMPELARWSTPDPVVAGVAADLMNAPWRLHPYQYVDQNPVMYWDPDGREPAPTAPATEPAEPEREHFALSKSLVRWGKQALEENLRDHRRGSLPYIWKGLGISLVGDFGLMVTAPSDLAIETGHGIAWGANKFGDGVSWGAHKLEDGARHLSRVFERTPKASMANIDLRSSEDVVVREQRATNVTLEGLRQGPLLPDGRFDWTPPPVRRAAPAGAWKPDLSAPTEPRTSDGDRFPECRGGT